MDTTTALIIIMLFFLLGLIVGGNLIQKSIYKDALEHNAMEIHPTTDRLYFKQCK